MGFGGSLIVDDGRTGIARGARISQSLAGHRLGRHLMYHCIEWSKTKGVIRTAATEILRSSEGLSHHEGYTTVLVMVIISFIQ